MTVGATGCTKLSDCCDVHGWDSTWGCCLPHCSVSLQDRFDKDFCLKNECCSLDLTKVQLGIDFELNGNIPFASK